jgi:hypothetical protein
MMAAGWDWTTFWFVIIIGVLVLALVLVFFWYLSLRKKRKAMPSHIELYFDENFRRIINEWDFVGRDRIKDFKKDMGKRLSLVGGDLDILEANKVKLDKRLTNVEKKMDKLEGL